LRHHWPLLRFLKIYLRFGFTIGRFWILSLLSLSFSILSQ
jgi:hypothetical protein